MARLVLLSEGFTGRTFELKGEKITVGRVSDNAFEIPESSVSSHHAEIVLQGSDVLIRDLGSTNGTFINGEQINEAVLKPGQILRFGTVELRLESPESGPATGATSKKAATLDHTRVIPQGVKLNELEGTRNLEFNSKSGFEKKSNKGTKIFVIGAIVVGVLLGGLLLFLVFGNK
ncbi:MAG: sigma-54 dependent transcriptional regulator, Fis family [Verrucomicrobiales bacterium]|nr:sigma-54 dependent transcriptional regulator, Fis family [Verrucomicrobiales bacterium]